MSLVQKLRENSVVIVVTIVIALLIVFSVLHWKPFSVLPQSQFGKGKGAGGDEDAPIIIAGGSLYIGAGTTLATLAPDGDHLAYQPLDPNVTALKVSNIEVRAGDNYYPFDVSGYSGSVVFSYCLNNGCGAGMKDVITLHFDPAGTGTAAIYIENTYTRHVGSFPRLLPNLWKHPKKGGRIETVQVFKNTTQLQPPADCGSDSDCDVVVHACVLGSGCMPHFTTKVVAAALGR